jgi:hypothetical protein
MNVNSLRESAKFIEYDDILERVSTQIMSIGDLIFAVSKVTPEEFAAHFKECVSSGRTVREFREVDDGEGRMFQ